MVDQILVEVTRGGVRESVHRGVAAVVDGDGNLIRAWGDPAQLIFPRSAMKPLQSLVLAEAGAQLSSQQWALSGASHDGEAMHRERVEAWLEALGHQAADLACGPAWPQHGQTRMQMIRAGQGPLRVIHNCSGKHCGQLALCKHNGWTHEGYDKADHPAQKAMLIRLAELAGEEPSALGVDGCSLPAPQISLYGFGRMIGQIAKAAQTGGSAAETVISAAITHPELTGGSKQWNGVLTKAAKGALYAKTGAEGVFSVTAPKAGYGIVVKITDGATRASEVATAGVIAQMAQALGVEKSTFEAFSDLRQNNADGIDVGAVRFVGGPGQA
ncbi:MAG: asparaginase [Pseudomonadota bacterium]